MSEQKFRPYFTAAELLEIIAALKQSPTPTRIGLIRYLEGFLLKINHGVITPAHILQPSISEKLGFSETGMSKEKLGEAAYQKQLINPLHCTPHEINLAMSYRYTHDLMSEQEEREYEKALGI